MLRARGARRHSRTSCSARSASAVTSSSQPCERRFSIASTCTANRRRLREVHERTGELLVDFASDLVPQRVWWRLLPLSGDLCSSIHSDSRRMTAALSVAAGKLRRRAQDDCRRSGALQTTRSRDVRIFTSTVFHPINGAVQCCCAHCSASALKSRPSTT